MRTSFLPVLGLMLACGDGAGRDPTSSGTSISSTTSDSATSSDSASGSTTSATDTASGTATTSTGSTGTTGGLGCTFCNEPNQQCIDDVCVTTCHGVTPDPCGPAQVCDVISGECVDPTASCTLAGDYETCDAAECGPGTVCDGQGACIAVAPCSSTVCLADGHCWGTDCSCERQHGCTTLPDETALNGPFATDIHDLEFADDCTAWMVTLRSGTDYVRRLTTDGTLTEWAGVANLNMGEVAVLKSLTPPAAAVDPNVVSVEGLGEVAITYTCCANCGCFVDPPQGVARLDENNVMEPLPLIIPAMVTQGVGPFGSEVADAGPHGLTWGEDRVLYVGNATASGNLDAADLELMTQEQLTPLPARLTAGAPISGAHLLLAVEGGGLYRYNILTNQAQMILDAGSDVTALSLDSFSGLVYASLRNLDVVAIDPFAETISSAFVMPAMGRVSVSPEGRLYYVPAKFTVPAGTISSWDIPDSF